MNTQDKSEEYANLKLLRDDHDVVTVILDTPDRSMNVLDAAMLEELSHLVGRLQHDGFARCLVIRSAKRGGFLAGADLQQLADLHTTKEVDDALKVGQNLFNAIAKLPMPTIAAIHGPCLGGGLELAMACRYRVAKDDPSTKLGLPETQLGLIPGWGGTQRLPQLVDLPLALQMMLEGKRLNAVEAESAGLVDIAAAPQDFEAELASFIGGKTGMVEPMDTMHRRRTLQRNSHWYSPLLRSSIGRRFVFQFARKQIKRQSHHYLALPAVLRAAERGLRFGLEAGLAAERDEFAKLIHTPTHHNLLRIATDRDRARKTETWVHGGVEPQAVQTIGVIGAGTMGAEIANAAAFSGFHVLLVDMNDEIVGKGMQRIESLTDKAVRKGVLSADDAKSKLRQITPTSNWQPLAGADLVIEAVVERMEVKRDVFAKLDRLLPSHALIVSNTSALSVTEMSRATERPHQVGGLHFFNPVHKMPLVEVVRGEQTNETTIATLVSLVKRLGKVPIVTGEGPGFVVNRILFPYLDEAVRMAREGVPIETIDREAKRFGMPMGPLELLDTVGIDVAASVALTLLADSENANTLEVLTHFVETGRLGRKSGRGFYAYRSEKKTHALTLPDVIVHSHRAMTALTLGSETFSECQLRLSLSMANEATKVIEEGIVSEPWMVDLAMVLGTGFAPFRGGPLRLIESWGVEPTVRQLEDFALRLGRRFTPALSSQHQVNTDSDNSFQKVEQ